MMTSQIKVPKLGEDMPYCLTVVIIVFAFFGGVSEASAWQTKSGSAGEVKSCQLSRVNKDGKEFLIVEASQNFQGIRIVSEQASKVNLTKAGAYGFDIALWTDQNPIVNVAAWRDLYGIYIPFSVGRWVNMWEFVLKTMVVYEGELRIGANRDDRAYPNNPDIRFDLTGIKKAFPAFKECLKTEFAYELKF